MAGSLDDNPPRLDGYRTVKAWQYVVIAETPKPGGARVYVHDHCAMTNSEIADQLERLATYVRRLP